MSGRGRTRRAGLVAMAVAAVIGGSTATAPVAEAARGDVRGRVTYVADGDTIHVRVGSRTHKVRVIGVDTPEVKGKQCYSSQATAATRGLVGGRTVILRADRTQPNQDAYRRLLRHVVLTDGTTLANRLISNGFGRELTVGKPYAGQAAYRRAQSRAQAKKRGLWGACGSTAAPRRRCVVKGNIASDGDRIFHVPGQKYYAATQIDTRKGERWFCSADEARRAGWRAAKV